MKHILRLTLFTLLYIAVASAHVAADAQTHFLADADYRAAVHADFASRLPLIKSALPDADAAFASLATDQREAMEFLYAYMPLNDVADYSFDFFRRQVATAFEARAAMPWGARVPDDVFRHFVLPYRVNNENLDSARMVLYPILRERLRGMSMYDAALEVNHWCHEYVTYRPADIRTSAPLATMRTGLGRCGEESTFTVTALRAAGIPARQCYTPRWAHCDDNHAWVEVWIDGQWMFLGACEPDPELNMGWFSIPSTRCMMVHTKAFGRYRGSEEVIAQAPCYSELNLLSHYATTRRVAVTVLNADGKPAVGAHVKFKLYNYSEYYTLADYPADSNGSAAITTGLGDLLVWATDGERYDYAKVDVRTDSVVTLRLTRQAGPDYVEQLDICPPQATKAKVSPTKAKVVLNTHRLAREDSMRNARMATFASRLPRSQWGVEPNDNLTDQQLTELITKSEGNYAEIIKFINAHTKRQPGLYLYDYLRSYSDKDLRDITASLLEHHLTYCPTAMPLDAYKRGIMPARISNEAISPWRRLPAYKAPADAAGANYYNCPVTPVGVDKVAVADPHSRDIYYVAACRAQGIPTYLDNATNVIYQWQGSLTATTSATDAQGHWTVVTPPSQATAASASDSSSDATLTLTYSGTEPKVPVYYPHFTLQRFVEGDFQSFDFEDDPRMASFPAQLTLPPGYYCLSTGNRYPNGDVLSRMEFFTLAAGQSLTKQITLRQLRSDRAQALPAISPDLKITPDSIALSNYAGVKGMLYINLGDYREPSKHLVNEMLQLRDEFNRWGGNIYIVAPADALPALVPFSTADIAPYVAEDLSTTSDAIAIASDVTSSASNAISSVSPSPSTLQQAIVRALNLDAQLRYPLALFITNTGQILYHTEGYSIGSAEQILKVASQF